MIINKEINFGKLQQEIAIVYQNIEGVSSIGNDYTFHGLTGNEDLTEIIENHNPVSLDEYKVGKYQEIDNKTQILISQGFLFDGKLFSLSIPAQSNWTNIKANKQDFIDLGAFPLGISCQDGSIYMLQEADVFTFWLTGMSTVKTHYNSGGILKEQVKNATTKEEIESIIDNR